MRGQVCTDADDTNAGIAGENSSANSLGKMMEQSGTDSHSSPVAAGRISESWNSWRGNIQPKGLPNFGNTCYMNAALQFLLASRPFLYTNYPADDCMHFLPPCPDVQKKKLAWFNSSKTPKSFRAVMRSLVEEMITERKRCIQRDTLRDFRKVASRGHATFSSSGQQDSMEYFLHLLNTIEKIFTGDQAISNPCQYMRVDLCEEIQRGTSVSYGHREEYVISCPLAEPAKPTKVAVHVDSVGEEIDAVNGADGKSTQAKQKSGVTSKVGSPSRPLPNAPMSEHTKLPSISSKRKETSAKRQKGKQPNTLKRYNILDCLDKFMAKEKVISRGPELVFKTTRIARLPEYLVIQPRMIVINHNGKPQKLRVHVDVPDEVDAKKWMCDPGWIDQCQCDIPRPQCEFTKYRLKAFVTHHGSTPHRGHYICHVKHGDQWYLCNDSRVISVPRPSTEHSYFYLYERNDVLEAYTKSRTNPHA